LRSIAVVDQQSASHAAARGHPRRRTSRAPVARRGGQWAEPSLGAGEALMHLGLTYIATEELTVRRLRHGRGFRYVAADGSRLRGAESKRLAGQCRRPTLIYCTPPIPGRTFRRSGATPPDACNTAIIPIGSGPRHGALPVSWRCCRRSGGASPVISAPASRPLPSRSPRSSSWYGCFLRFGDEGQVSGPQAAAAPGPYRFRTMEAGFGCRTRSPR
jgi:hypothetical protein